MGLFRKKTDLVYSTPSPRNLKRVLVIIAIIIIAMSVISFAIKTQKRSSFQTASLSFFKLVQSGDATGSYEYLAPGTKLSTTKTNWQSRVTTIQRVFKGQTPKFTSETIITSPSTKKEEGHLDIYTVKGSDGTYKIEMLMTNEAPTKVLNFNSRRTGTN